MKKIILSVFLVVVLCFGVFSTSVPVVASGVETVGNIVEVISGFLDLKDNVISIL